MNIDDNPKQIKRDNCLLKFDERFDQDNKESNPFLNKFILKPSISKIESSFLTKDKFEFLDKFMISTNELEQNITKQKEVNIEQNKMNRKDKYVEMDLKIGVLDILPSDNKSTTTLASSNIDLLNLVREKSEDTELNEEDIINSLKNDQFYSILKGDDVTKQSKKKGKTHKNK